MADCVEDKFISKTYAKIARDEGFHANIGGMKLAQLVTTAEQQAAVEALVGKMRKDLFDISCKNTQEVASAKELVSAAYGW